MDLVPLLLIIGISLAVGVAIGFLLASLRQSPPDQPKPSPSPPLEKAPRVAPDTLAPLTTVETPPKKGMVDLIAGSLQPESRASSAATKSIALQVDEILQERLRGTALESRAVRILELPGKGMVVMVGLEQYASVNDVPDAEIQAALRAAVAEWESQSSGI